MFAPNRALQEAQDIFGVDFDYDEFDKYDEEEYEEEEESQEDVEERERRRKKTKKKAGQKATKKSIFELYEPSELKRGHFTDFDNQVRNSLQMNPQQPKVFGLKFSLREIGRIFFCKIRNFKP